MPLFKSIRNSIRDIVERVEAEIRSHEESVTNTPRFCEPYLDFKDPDYRDHPDQWAFVVRRSDWPDFEYYLEFRGTTFERMWAGD
jgi:hypothetical protein